MGAHESNIIKVGKYRDPNQAYMEAVREAQEYYGKQPYNGTISTSHGFIIRKDNPRYGTKKFWEYYIDTLSGTKFSEWNCIEIKGTRAKTIKISYGFKGKRNVKVYFFWGLAAS